MMSSTKQQKDCKKFNNNNQLLLLKMSESNNTGGKKIGSIQLELIDANEYKAVESKDALHLPSYKTFMSKIGSRAAEAVPGYKSQMFHEILAEARSGSLSEKHKKLVETRAASDNLNKSQELMFATSSFFMSAMPSKLKRNKREARVSNVGNKEIWITPSQKYGLPSGRVARYIFLYLITRTVKEQDFIIHTGSSAYDFIMKFIGRRPSKIDYQIYLRQYIKVIHSRIEIHNKSVVTKDGVKKTRLESIDYRISDQRVVVFSEDKTAMDFSWESEIRLDKDFYEQCMKHSFPFRRSSLMALSTPLAIDIYLWLVYRQNTSKSLTYLSWQNLGQQFYGNHFDLRKHKYFKPSFAKSLIEVLCLMPKSNVHLDKKGLIIGQSKNDY